SDAEERIKTGLCKGYGQIIALRQCVDQIIRLPGSRRTSSIVRGLPRCRQRINVVTQTNEITKFAFTQFVRRQRESKVPVELVRNANACLDSPMSKGTVSVMNVAPNRLRAREEPKD